MVVLVDVVVVADARVYRLDEFHVEIVFAVVVVVFDVFVVYDNKD